VPTTVPLFARLDPREAAALAALSTERRIPAGEPIVSGWDTTREFYVLEDGVVEVLVEDELVATVRPGDYFGEIAALEWGAGFARSRAATVVARENARVRVLAPNALEQLLEEFPRLESEIRRTAHDRLRGLR
jgi:CRP-like cAMP-binding protein